MANTYKLISSVAVGSGGSAGIALTSIPATYTDLMLKLSLRGTSTAGPTDKWVDVSIGFNAGGSNTSVTNRILYGLGDSVGETTSTTPSGGAMPTSDATASTFSNCEIYVYDYAGSTNKIYSMDNVTENNATKAVTSLTHGLWSNTAAITSINFYPAGGNFAEYSTVHLYGIKNS